MTCGCCWFWAWVCGWPWVVPLPVPPPGPGKAPALPGVANPPARPPTRLERIVQEVSPHGGAATVVIVVLLRRHADARAVVRVQHRVVQEEAGRCDRDVRRGHAAERCAGADRTDLALAALREGGVG